MQDSNSREVHGIFLTHPPRTPSARPSGEGIALRASNAGQIERNIAGHVTVAGWADGWGVSGSSG